MRFIPELDLPESADHLFPIELFMRMKWLRGLQQNLPITSFEWIANGLKSSGKVSDASGKAGLYQQAVSYSIFRWMMKMKNSGNAGFFRLNRNDYFP